MILPSAASKAAPNTGRTAKRIVGIDVGGLRTGLLLCLLDVGADGTVDIAYRQIPCSKHLPDSSRLLPRIEAGDMAGLADRTWDACVETCDIAAPYLSVDGELAADAVFLDSPSALSRNELGHGRLTEKSSVPGVTFLTTPSIACGRRHRGGWAWMINGLCAYMAAFDPAPSRSAWEDALAGGFHKPAIDHHRRPIRETFPAAVIESLRQTGDQQALIDLVKPLETAALDGQKSAAPYIVAGFARYGVTTLRGRSSAFDEADALIAALAALPHFDDRFEPTFLRPAPDAEVRWQSERAEAAADEEGFIELPKRRT